MTLVKAIELLRGIEFLADDPNTPDIRDAIQLGIEALKWRQLMELDYGSWCGPLLPGETTDE